MTISELTKRLNQLQSEYGDQTPVRVTGTAVKSDVGFELEVNFDFDIEIVRVECDSVMRYVELLP